jgi:hypothetical protein
MTVGIATSLNYFCTSIGCGAGGSIKARIRKNGMQQNQTEWKAHQYVPTSNVPANAFNPNMRLLVLEMQQIGGGELEAIVLGGMLDLCPAALKN